MNAPVRHLSLVPESRTFVARVEGGSALEFRAGSAEDAAAAYLEMEPLRSGASTLIVRDRDEGREWHFEVHFD